MSSIVKGLHEAVDIKAMQDEYRTLKADILQNADMYSEKYGIPVDDKYFAEKVMTELQHEEQRTKQNARDTEARQQVAKGVENDKANIQQLKAELEKAKQGFDPNFEYSDDHTYWSEQQRKQSTIQGLEKRIKAAGGMNESAIKSGLVLSEARTYKLWESAGQKLMEAQLTQDQINQIFQYIEKIETAGGDNRTMIGKGKDAATNLKMQNLPQGHGAGPAWGSDAGKAAKRVAQDLAKSKRLSESQVYLIISRVVERQTKLDEGIMDTIKGAAGSAMGKAANWAQTKGTNLTTKITADKLLQAWKKAGSPMDSLDVASIIQRAGVASDTIKQVYKNMQIPFAGEPGAGALTQRKIDVDPSSVAPPDMAQPSAAGSSPASASAAPAASASTPPASTPQEKQQAISAYQKVKKLVDQLDKRNKQRVVDTLRKDLQLAESGMELTESEVMMELSPQTLASYKKKAGADASAADKAGDTKRADKRFSGIVKATKKEFDNDAKGVVEGTIGQNVMQYKHGSIVSDKVGNKYKVVGYQGRALVLQGTVDGKRVILFPHQLQQGVAEGKGPSDGNLALALRTLSGSWSGWHDVPSLDPNIEKYEYDDGEGGHDATGSIDHNLETGEITVDYSGDYGENEVKGTFHSIGDAMNALRGGYPGSHGSGKAPNFDTLGGREFSASDDLYKTDRAGKKGTLTKARMDTMKASSPYRMRGGPKGVLPEQSVVEEINLEESFDMKIDELMVNEDWQKVNKKDKTDGMSRKAVKAYRRENPGSKLKTAVTTKPSKLKKGSKAAKRRKSFCARMSGMKKAHASAKTKRDPDSPINKALRRWNCESIEQMQELIMIAESKIAEAKNAKQQAAIAIAKKAAKKG